MDIASRLLYEDNHLIIVNKLSGELVQGDFTGDQPLLEKVRTYIKEKYNKPGNVFCGLIHRLDRPTSGIVAFAKTSKGLSRMNKLFEQRLVDKRYYAVVKEKPVPTEAKLVNYLAKNAQKNKSFVYSDDKRGAKRAELDYKYLASSEKYHLLEIKLYTGRHHQIRVQLAHIGSPIKGDLKYHYPRSNHDASISLHAGLLSFEHPISKEAIEIKAACLGSDVIWRIFNPKILDEVSNWGRHSYYTIRSF